ncbi:Crp/Fnr family transcriptional regulator [Sphingomonas sp. SM33]|uniref:Crp/Fnr family transcriptional regulator n=1 Tax=Sphingomonas telluris TaxID=2907998 RepID=A0ABS9VNJ5_9SPHN|nr:Crp/Fnr family transcriptional regulator [Sphingomonas telluris]MCH8616550.1 Crp/Fnr family transcriptional regulator [Sphingomonas telluris]
MLDSVAELNPLEEAFAGNLLLKTVSQEIRELLLAVGERVELPVGERVQTRGQDVEWSYFPFGSTMISLVVQLSDGRSIEVASIGREGAVGGIISCGHAPAFGDARVQVSGSAMRVPMEAIERAKRQSGFISNIFCRYSDYLLAQVQQSAACNALHPINQRAARWLLTAQDRAGDRIELTQEALAGLLGVQRTTLNAVVRTLQDEGLITIKRGRIIVLDRRGLERNACECYAAVEKHFAAVIGESGSGNSG